MRQISVAVVGCGIWGFNHARVYSGLDNVRLVKVVDVNPARARAALGLDQLEMLDGFLAGRRRVARLLDAAVRGLGCVTPQRVEPRVESCYNYYTVRLDLDALRCSRDLFAEALRAENIECSVYYPSPLTRHPLLGNDSTCPNAEELSRSVLGLSMHPFLGECEIEAVAEALGKVVSHFLR